MSAALRDARVLPTRTMEIGFKFADLFLAFLQFRFKIVAFQEEYIMLTLHGIEGLFLDLKSGIQFIILSSHTH